MAKIIWTAEAKQCLQELFDYIFPDNPSVARHVVSEIYRKVQLLRQFPELGWKYEPIEDREIRILLYGHYRIAYQICSDSRIFILGIFHAAMDIEKYLQ